MPKSYEERAQIQAECEDFFAENTDFIRDTVGDDLFAELEESFG